MNDIIRINEATGNTLEEDLHYFVHNPTKPFRAQFMDEPNSKITSYGNGKYVFIYNIDKAKLVLQQRKLNFHTAQWLLYNIDYYGLGFPILSTRAKDSSYENSWRHNFFKNTKKQKRFVSVVYNIRHLYDTKSANIINYVIRIVTMHICNIKRVIGGQKAMNDYKKDEIVQKMEEIKLKEKWTWRPDSIPVTEDELLLLQEDDVSSKLDDERQILTINRIFERYMRCPHSYMIECFEDNDDYDDMYNIDSSRFTAEQLHNLSIFNKVNVECFNASILRLYNAYGGMLPKDEFWDEHNIAMYAIVEGESQHMIRVKMMDAFGEDAILPPLTKEDLKTFKFPARNKLRE